MGSDANDLYEVFLLLKVVEAGRAAGYGVHLAYDSPQPSTKNSKIPPPTELCVRRSPAHLYSAKDSLGRYYTHLVLTNAHAPALGVYVGVRVMGRSGVLSEADVLVMDEGVARSRVSAKEDPKAVEGDVRIHIEGKNYSDRVNLAAVRSFVGMAADFYTTQTVPRHPSKSLMAATQVGKAAEEFGNDTPSVPTIVFSGTFPGNEAALVNHLKDLLSPCPIGLVHPGAYCAPAGLRGRTAKETPMTCALAADGRLRWKRLT